MEGPQKTKTRTTTRSSNSTPGYISGKKRKTLIQKDIYLNIHSGTICNSQDMEANQVSIKRRSEGFPGGAVVESPLADAGDTGSCPGPGGSRMQRSG